MKDKPRIKVNMRGSLYHCSEKIEAPESWNESDSDELLKYQSSLLGGTTLFRINLNPVYVTPYHQYVPDDYGTYYGEEETTKLEKIKTWFTALTKGDL